MTNSKLLAIWAPTRGIWESPEGTIDLFSEHSEPYSETWPSSGSMRSGRAYAPRTSGLLTDESVFSSSGIGPRDFLPTPTARNVHGAGEHGEGAANLQTVAAQLLPTPIVSDSSNGVDDPLGKHARSGVTPQLRDVAHLLPTPAAAMHNDGEDAEHWEERRARLAAKHGNNGAGTPLPIAVQTAEWGKYAAAIARAERVIGRSAPAPTEATGKTGKQQLSPRFVEWMMLLPAGTVTGHGLGRRPELARLGNGVVPLQAAYAFAGLVQRAATHRASS